MSDLIASVLFVFAIYCAWACAIHQPSTAPIAHESQPINYFPEVEEIEEKTPPEPTPIVIFENRPVAAFTLPVATVPATNYATLSIRQLKAECQKLTGTDRAIAGYSRLNRQQLITALSAS